MLMLSSHSKNNNGVLLYGLYNVTGYYTTTLAGKVFIVYRLSMCFILAFFESVSSQTDKASKR